MTPDACVGEEAEQVAAYIYEAFYSPLAQARIRPPEIDLARLTGAAISHIRCRSRRQPAAVAFRCHRQMNAG
jgi:hypothetical protein